MSIAVSLSSARYGAAALAATVALAAAGCGPSGTRAQPNAILRSLASTRAAHETSASTRPVRQAFASAHTVQQVEQHFQAVTGQRLTDSQNAGSDTLSLPADNTQDYNRFGSFTITVLHRPDEQSAFTTHNGRRLIRDAQGVYWPQAADSAGYLTAVKVYGNVVLTWTTSTRATNGKFTLLDAILSTLGHNAAWAIAKLPASELSCQQRGITPTGTRKGTCQQNAVTRTVVNSGSD